MSQNTDNEAEFFDQLATLKRQAMEKEFVFSRVRDEVWKMHDAQGFEQVLIALRSGLEMLQVPFFECGINIIEERDDSIFVRSHNMDRKGQWSTVEQNIGSALIADFWRSGEPVYRADLTTEDLYDEKLTVSENYGGEIRSVLDIPFSQGTLAVNSTEIDPFTPEHIELLRQLAHILSEGFQRMQDLQALAERNRELEHEVFARERREKLQAAQYRVRDQVWRMRGVEDIEMVLAAVYNNLDASEIPFTHCSVNLLDEGDDSEKVVIYSAGRKGQWHRYEFPLEPDTPFVKIWKSQQRAYRPDLEHEDPYGERKNFTIAIRAVADAPFPQGTLAISSTEANAFSADDLSFLTDMASLLGEGFRRMEDLRTLTQRNRELEKEVAERELRGLQLIALELVRRQVWEMKDVGGIDQVMDAVGHALEMLSIPFRVFGVNIVDDSVDPPTARFSSRFKNEDGTETLTGAGWSKPGSSGLNKAVVDIWREGEILYRRDLQAEDGYGVLTEKNERYRRPVRCILDIPFSRGTLAVNSPEPNAFSDTDIAFMGELADVLSEGFRRMDDLQTLTQHNLELEREISERHQAEEALRQAKEDAEAANRAKSTFLARMSHELRTPLNAILGFAQLMRREAAPRSKDRESLDIINRSGEHLLGLINDVLEMSRIEAGQTELNEQSFDLHYLLENLDDMFRLRAEHKGLVFSAELVGDVPRFICADEGKLRQVAINLLGNAVKFTEEGRVALRISYQTARLICEVEDSGPGIATSELNTLFEAFTQTGRGQQAQEGTGLGLPISRQFVRLMGGDIEVKSQPDKGSLFSFTIPISPGEAAENEASQPARRVVGLAPGQAALRMLVVEDQPENRQLLESLLAAAGFEVRGAADGLEGTEAYRSWQPHLVWMDMRMPVMDGYEATRRIKSDDGDTVVIALTASAFEEDREQVLAAGCDDFVRKPYREEDIWEAIDRHLDIRFIYADAERDRNADGIHAPVFDATDLPDEWLAELRQAATRADGEWIQRLAGNIADGHAELARTLEELSREFRFDEILALFGRRKSDAS